jgi:hypothetical protein
MDMSAFCTTVRVLVAAIALGGSLGAGCATSDTSPGSGDGSVGEVSHRPGPEQYAADDQGRRGGEQGDDEPLVPKTARQVAEGRGDLSYKATRDGFVYVIDNRDKKVIYEGPIDKDETLTIAPYRNAVEIDGKRVKRVKDLDNKHIHRIYFERAGDRGRDRRNQYDL